MAHRSPLSLRKANPVGSIGMIRAKKGLAGFVPVNFLNFLAFHVLPSVSVLFAPYRHGGAYPLLGPAPAPVGACTVIAQGLPVRRCATRSAELLPLLVEPA